MWFTLENMQGCENLPSLQEQGGGSSAERCSDGEQSVPSKLRSTREASSCNAKKTGSSTSSRSGMTLEHSTADRGAERSMSSAEVSPVRTLARPGKDSALSEEREAVCGESTPGSFARYDRATASWKTHQCSLFGGLESFSGTWPREGMMRHGRCYQLAIVAPRMNGRECGSSQKIPTPRSNDAIDVTINPKILLASSYDSQRNGLTAFVTKWPTPRCHDANDSSMIDKTKVLTSKCNSERLGLVAEVYRRTGLDGGKLNPDWVDWLMGFPIFWTALKPMEMVKFQSWLSGRFVI